VDWISDNSRLSPTKNLGSLNAFRLPKFFVGDSLELSEIQSTPPKRMRHRPDSFVVVWRGGVN